MILDHLPFLFLPFVFWVFIIMLLAAAVTFALLAWVRKLPFAIWVAAGSLALALLLSLSTTTSQLSTEHVSAGGAAGAIIALLGVALAAFGGGPAAQLALALATRGSVTAGTHGGILVSTGGTSPEAPVPATATTTANQTAETDATAHPTKEVLRGGAAIGLLERLCVVLGIIAGFPEAIAIIVAIKGLGRFTELATAEARERFIIGTLASLLWASACGVLVRIALGS